MRHLTNAIALAALLSIAAGCAQTTTQTDLATACQGYASALSTAALNKDRLTDQQISTVNSVRQTVNPICTNLTEVEDAQTALSTVRTATRKLNDMEVSQ
jgi:hypothetical protein